ncbi:MAG: B12-binding domain-containing radical SAM protein [Promethearchaeota archaeon]
MHDICLLNGITEFQDENRMKVFQESATFIDGVLYKLNSDLFLREPPTGLMILAAIMENNGYSVDIIDSSILQEPRNYILENADNYRIIGITGLTNTFNEILQTAKLIKQKSPQTYVFLGGPHASFEYKEILNRNPEIDLIFIGESENSFPFIVDKVLNYPIIDFIERGESEKINETMNKPGKIQMILNSIAEEDKLPNGIAYQKNIPVNNLGSQKKIIDTGFPEAVDLSKLPLPARHLISRIYSVADVIINRGCPNKCSFCSRTHLFPQMRIRPVDQVLEEAKYIASCGNYKFVNFYDNININHRYLNTFLDGLIAQKFTLPWGAELRADVITEAEAKKIKKANCKIVATGVESASEEVLKTNFKFQDPKKVAKGIRIFKDAGIAVQAYFVIGLPGDNWERFNQTLAFVRTLGLETGIDRVEFFVATPYPGSDLAMNKEKYGIKILNENFSDYDCRKIIMETQSLDTQDIERMIKKAQSLKEELKLL